MKKLNKDALNNNKPFSFDGRGINGGDEYMSRIATFTEHGHALNKEYKIAKIITDALNKDTLNNKTQINKGVIVDPIDAGEELADYISQRRNQLMGDLFDSAEFEAVYAAFVLTCERDFWRAKALGCKLP